MLGMILIPVIFCECPFDVTILDTSANPNGGKMVSLLFDFVCFLAATPAKEHRSQADFKGTLTTLPIHAQLFEHSFAYFVFSPTYMREELFKFC